jgi:hypothetical protein
MIQSDPKNEDEIARLYEQASHYYEELGLDTEFQNCWEKLVYYRHLPEIKVEGHIHSKFREGEFNTIELVILNIGNGIAYNVRINAGSSRFEIDEEKMLEVLNKRLSPGGSHSVNIYIRPKKDQVGEVPLALEWSWQDRFDNSYHGRTTTPVTVLRQEDRSPSSEPQIINIGTIIQGDHVGGDKVADGGYKGDKVEINHDQGSTHRQSKATNKPFAQRLCPNCHLPVQPEDAHCTECGFQLSSDE